MAPPTKETSHDRLAKFLNAAFEGNLDLLKQIGKVVDNGEGLKKTFETMKDEGGKTALHFAASGGRTGVCKYLIETLKFDVNMQDGFGQTPLHQATLGDNTKQFDGCIKYLLKAGADANVTNSYGLTPLEVAALNGNHKGVMNLFPVTARIPSIPKWTASGVIKYVHSAEAKQQRELKGKESFSLAKSNGKDAFDRKDYMNAIFFYTVANKIDPKDAKVLSNRSLCWALLNDGNRALADAEACISLDDMWFKGYYRTGVAYKLLKRYGEAAVSFQFANGLNPGNDEVEKAFREAAAACGSKVINITV